MGGYHLFHPPILGAELRVAWVGVARAVLILYVNHFVIKDDLAIMVAWIRG